MANNNNTGRQIEMTSMLVDIYFTDGNALLSNSKDQIQKKNVDLLEKLARIAFIKLWKIWKKNNLNRKAKT